MKSSLCSFQLLLVSLLLFMSTPISTPLLAHEFWFEPLDFTIDVNEEIKAHEKVGSNFKGNEYAYLATSYESFNITVRNKTRPIKSRLGDLPAVNELVTKEGLAILSATTTDSDLVYKTNEKFQTFLRNQGLEWVNERHRQRGLPEKGFKEIYRRYPKSLIKVGHGKGTDKPLGLLLELVVETNPYTEQGPIKIKLLWQGKPLINKRVNIFNRKYKEGSTVLADSKLLESYLITDSDGRIQIPREKGGLFLVSAVHMIEPSAIKMPSASPKTKFMDNDAVWESLWASTTYRLDKTNN